MIEIPIGKLLKLVGKLISVAPGGITPAERDELLAMLLDLAASLAPDSVSIKLPGKK